MVHKWKKKKEREEREKKDGYQLSTDDYQLLSSKQAASISGNIYQRVLYMHPGVRFWKNKIDSTFNGHVGWREMYSNVLYVSLWYTDILFCV